MIKAMRGGIRHSLRLLVVLITCTAMVACTTLRPIQGTPDELHEGLRTGRLVKAGDLLGIRTASGERYELRVAAIDNEAVHGEDQVVKHKPVAGPVVPIADIVGLEKQEVSAIKTTSLVIVILAAIVGFAYATCCDINLGSSGAQ